MALNVGPNPPLTFKYLDEKDMWKIVLFERGWVHFKLEGKFVRSCYKWLKNGGRTWMTGKRE
jgi:hypothetical protein